MENAVYIGLSQQMALRRQMDITANNIANLNTTAFKGVHPMFEEYLVNEQQQSSMSYVQDYGVYHDKSEGVMEHTARPLDMAINGDGYFTIETDAGLRYTRNGSFSLDPEGTIVTSRGDYLLDETGRPIQVDINSPDVEIATDGTVNLGNGETVKIELVAFDNQQLLKQIGSGYYDAEGIASNPAVNTKLIQGSLEKSNVQPILEMTTMIDIMRNYQAAQKLLDAQDDMQMKAIEELPAIQ